MTVRGASGAAAPTRRSSPARPKNHPTRTTDLPRMLPARVTHLEMRARPGNRVHAPTGFKLALMRVEAIPLHFYRYLYEVIGKPHHWQMRRNLADSDLSAIVHADTTEIEVLY